MSVKLKNIEIYSIVGNEDEIMCAVYNLMNKHKLTSFDLIDLLDFIEYEENEVHSD